LRNYEEQISKIVILPNPFPGKTFWNFEKLFREKKIIFVKDLVKPASSKIPERELFN
jgi:hypothetical protein